jgi:hypothetical protein
MDLRKIADARSGDKGSHVNIGLIAKTEEGYEWMVRELTEEKISRYFSVSKVTRYLWPNLRAINFVLIDALGEGGGLNLRMDSQGKTFGEALLEMEISDVSLH